jgi:hypothetical protein
MSRSLILVLAGVQRIFFSPPGEEEQTDKILGLLRNPGITSMVFVSSSSCVIHPPLNDLGKQQLQRTPEKSFQEGSMLVFTLHFFKVKLTI